MERIAVTFLHLAVILNSVSLLRGRLIERSPDKTSSTPEPELIKSIIYQRLLRESLGPLDEKASSEDKKYIKARHVIRTNGNESPLSRLVRSSKERHYAQFDKVTPQFPTQVTYLVKKPIPKFFDIDHDNDFQNTIDNVNLKLVDSGADNEDEDFNINDYDFDVNHDEFIGQAKPLEPRLRKIESIVIEEINKAEETTTTTAPPVIKTEKIVLKKQGKQTFKREYPVMTYKPNMTRDDDYSDESVSSTSVKTPEKMTSEYMEYFTGNDFSE